MSGLLWIITTTGGRQVFVREVLGSAYDSQAERLLRGDPGVDVDAIRPEAILIGGEARMYFGPFPAFFRVPLNFIYPAGRGCWSRLSGFCAAEVSLFAFAGLIALSLRASSLSSRARNWIGNACLVGFTFGSPLLFLIGNLSIYNEAIIWGLAWSIAALYLAFRTISGTATGSTRVLLGFSICAACALLSRATFGAPFLLIAALLAFQVGTNNRLRQLTALFLPLAAGLAFFLLLSYAKFGTWTGVDYAHYINSVHRDFAHEHGVFDLRRVPFSFADYFRLRPPAIESHSPFLKADRHPYPYPSLYSVPFSETYLPVTWCSSWLVFGSCIGIIYLFRKGRTNVFERGIAAALFAQFLCILSFFALAQRYSADLYPFLIFCFVVFLRASALAWQRGLMSALIVVSIAVNFLATASWIGSDGNLPAETRVFWNAIVEKTRAGSSQ